MKVRYNLFLSAVPMALFASAGAMQPVLAQARPAQPAQPSQRANPAQPSQQGAAQRAQPSQPAGPATSAQPSQQGAAQPAQPAQRAGAQSGIAPGARVSDTQGGEVGTVTRVDGQFVVLRTDKHEVRLPIASFTPAEGGLLIALTRAQLNAEVEKTLAEAAAKLAPGAAVTGSQGSPVGTIQAIEGEFVTLKLTSGTLVRLPRSGIAPAPGGAVIGMTAAELDAAAAAAAGPSK